MADLSRRQIIGSAAGLALLPTAPASAAPIDSVAFHALELKKALDALLPDSGSRWFVAMAGKAGAPCQLADILHFERNSDELGHEDTHRLLPKGFA